MSDEIEIKAKKGMQNIVVNGKVVGQIQLEEGVDLAQVSKLMDRVKTGNKPKGKPKQNLLITKIYTNEFKTEIIFDLDNKDVLTLSLIDGTLTVDGTACTKVYINAIKNDVYHLQCGTDATSCVIDEEEKWIENVFDVLKSHHNISSVKQVGSLLLRVKLDDLKMAEAFGKLSNERVSISALYDIYYKRLKTHPVPDKHKWNLLKVFDLNLEEFAYMCKGGYWRNMEDTYKYIANNKKYYAEVVQHGGDYMKQHIIGRHEEAKKFINNIDKYDLNVKLACNYFDYGFAGQGLDHYHESTYYDYLSMNKDMEVEGYEKYPRNLLTEHHILQANYKLVANQFQQQKFAEHKYQEYNHTGVTYSVIAPRDMGDLKIEGTQLSHCVASYAERMAEGKVIILFIRANTEIDRPLYTIEVRGQKVAQCRGKCNKAATPEIKDFIKVYERNKLQDLARAV